MTAAAATLRRLARPWDRPSDLAGAVPGWPNLPSTLQAALATAARTAPRVTATLAPPPPPTLRPNDLAPDHPLMMERGALEALARLAGAVWHAPSILRVVAREPRARLAAALGTEALAMAARHRTLAPPLSRPALDADALPAAVERAGRAALVAWAGAGPTWLAARLRLRLGGAVPPEHDAGSAAAIVDAVLTDLAAPRG